MEKKSAFTLAEVLITLGIISVVAALTMPALINNYQKHVTVTRLEHAYSVLSQAIKMSETVNGSIEYWDITGADDGTFDYNENTYDCGKKFSEKYIFPFLQGYKECAKYTTECVPDNIYALNGETTPYTSSKSSKLYTFALNNGTVFTIWPRSFSGIVEVTVDINGISKPNMLGKDVFFMMIPQKPVSSSFWGDFKHGGVYLLGSGFSRNYIINQSPNKCARGGDNNSGAMCAGLIQIDGWKISDDYPW